MDEYRPDHEAGGQRTDDRPRRAPPVVHDRHGHAGRLFHQPPDNVHALRDTPHVPVADFPGPPVHGHLRHPPHGITERAERPPRRHFHGATARYRAAACTSASRSMSQNSSRVYPRLSDSTASCRLTPLIARQSDAAHTAAMATRERRRSASTTARRATRSNVAIQRTATARVRGYSTWLAPDTTPER